MFLYLLIILIPQPYILFPYLFLFSFIYKTLCNDISVCISSYLTLWILVYITAQPLAYEPNLLEDYTLFLPCDGISVSTLCSH
nr:MAG TPA: hypothetical protein [Caudoviricetes sp.]